MQDEVPKFITIMPDYGPCYASYEDGCAIEVAEEFANHPNVETIKKIENQLYNLAYEIENVRADNNSGFPWQALDQEAQLLTEKLRQALADTGVSIVYKPHFNNPLVKNALK